MLKKLVFVLILVAILSLFTSMVAIAATASGSNCPTGFHLEEAMQHHEHDHRHEGTSADQNGDGLICVKHITPDGSIHVHIDNNVLKEK